MADRHIATLQSFRHAEPAGVDGSGGHGAGIDRPEPPEPGISTADERPNEAAPEEGAPELRRRPLLEAFDHIDRAVTTFRLVPVLMLIGVLWWAQTVLVPLVVSILVSYALEPAVARLKAWRIPRAIGAPLVLLGVIACLSAVAYGLRGQAVAFSDRLPEAAHKIAQAMTRGDVNAGPVAKMQQAARELEKAAAASRPPRPADDVTPVRVEEPTFRWSDWLWQGSHGAADMVGQLIAIVCLVYFLLAAGDLYKRKLVRIVGPAMSEKRNTVEILAEIRRQIARFLWARSVISGFVGAAMWLGCHWLGLEDPGVWAVISAVLFAVPVVGPLIVIGGAAVAGFVQFGTLGMAGAAAGLTAVIAAIEGNVLTPLLMSRVGEMNAVAVFVSLMFWGWLWGIWGLLLAVPITAALKAICDRVEGMEAFAELLKE